MIPREAATHYGVSLLTIYNWIKSGCPADTRKQGLQTYYTLDEKKVNEWLVNYKAVK